MAAMGSMGSMALLWFDTPSMALKQVLLMRIDCFEALRNLPEEHMSPWTRVVDTHGSVSLCA